MNELNEWGELITSVGELAVAPGPIIPPMPDQSGRSPHWPAFLRAFLGKKKNRRCAGCGRPATTAHHVLPFHLFPDQELNEDNLVPVERADHFVICHAGNWALYVPDARKALAAQLRRVERAIAAAA